MIASAQEIRNGSRRALGELVRLRVRGLGSIRCSGEGEHGVRPYADVVGANMEFALHAFQEVT